MKFHNELSQELSKMWTQICSSWNYLLHLSTRKSRWENKVQNIVEFILCYDCFICEVFRFLWMHKSTGAWFHEVLKAFFPWNNPNWKYHTTMGNSAAWYFKQHFFWYLKPSMRYFNHPNRNHFLKKKGGTEKCPDQILLLVYRQGSAKIIDSH